MALDRTIIWLGLLMIGMTLFVTIVANPPVGEALRQTVLPDVIDFASIITIVGGTVGGYITYAGAHRLLDKGLTGADKLGEITRGALMGIAVTGLMRFLLFLAVLGVIAAGVTLDLTSQTREPDGAGVPGRARRLGRAHLRDHLLGGRHHLGHRRGLHLGELPDRVPSDGRPRAQHRHGRLHRRLARRLPVSRHRARGAAGVRRRLQRPDPADRPDDLRLDRLRAVAT